MAVISIVEATLDNVASQQLQDGLIKEIAEIFTTILKKVELTIRPKITNLIKEAIQSSPEYKAMLPGGVLYGQVGRPNIGEILDNIIDAIAKEVEINTYLPNISLNNITAAMEINILELSFEQVQRVSGTYFDSENDFPVDWLNWLLFEGTRKVVIGYHFTRKFSKRTISRTGAGIMGKYGTWGFPGEYAGTATDNWLTRSMDSFEDLFVSAVESEFQKAAI